MADRPHPADYMTDSQYEQFRRDGGLHYASLEADILNYSVEADEEFIMDHYSGASEELHDRIIEVALDQWPEALDSREDALEYFDERLDAGGWVTLVDGEIVEMGEFHPFRIVAEMG